MKISPFIITVLLAICLGACAHVGRYQSLANGVRFTAAGTDVTVQFYGDSTVKVQKQPLGATGKPLDLVVVQPQVPVEHRVETAGNRLRLISARLTVSIDLDTGKITYFSNTGQLLLTELAKGAEFTPVQDAGKASFAVTQRFKLTTDENIYGLGQLQNGQLSQRGQTVRMVQDNTEDFVPYFMSTKGYGLYWDNYAPTTFSDTESETSFASDVGHAIRYYVMYGGDADGTVALMRKLTGEVPMLPLWTYGYWQSKERYQSQDETLGVVQAYRRLGVPLDGIIQDWQYWGDNYHWNAMAFLNPEFPNPQQLIDDVHALNAHIIISIWSSFGPKTPQYPILADMDALFNFQTWPQSGKQGWPPDMDYPSGVRVYDAFNPAAREVYWNFMEKGLLALGMDGWWMDSTEPDHFEKKPADLDEQTYLGSLRSVRNAYPLVTVGGVYEHQREVTEDKRVFILTRSAFAGQQRFGSQVWSGDVVASWQNLAKQITAGLNFSLCGIPYWNSDIGGFFLWDFPNKLEDPEYRELYTRWLQFGTFTPMMRSHGADAPREIYQFGEPGTPYYDAIEKFIQLRYRLLPYLYATAWQVSAHQSTFMRALVMDFPSDPRAVEDKTQYMFGPALLVKPVTTPLYSTATDAERKTPATADFSSVKSTSVYLPEGASWFDFWSNAHFAGGQLVGRATPLDLMPVYVRAGSILPWGPAGQYAEEKNWQELTIKVYPGADATFELYEDENDNYNYEQGAYSTITFTWHDATRELHLGKREGNFAGLLEDRVFNIELIQGAAGQAPLTRTIHYNGDPTRVVF